MLLFSLFILSFFYNKGINYTDEGYILHAAQRVHNGEIPYKDFNFIYTPGSIFVISAGFSLLDESILTGRLIVVVVAVITSLLIYILARSFTKNIFSQFLPVLLYLSWTPIHINFPLPINFCILTGLLSLYLFTKIIEKNKPLHFFLLGLTISCTFLFKQNFGVALIFVFTMLFIVFKKFSRKHISYYVLGLILGFANFLLYLLLTNSLVQFINYSFFSFQEYFPRHTVVAPSIYDSSNFFWSILKIFIYLSPLIISLLGVIFALDRKNKILSFAISSVVISYFLVGIYPSTDYVHISPLLGLLGLPLITLIQVKKFKIFAFSYMIFLFFTIVGFYTAYYKGFYRWEAPIKDQKYYLDTPRIMVWSDNKDLPMLVKYIQSNSSLQDYIYFYFYEPMIYFISDRKNPIIYLDPFIPDEKQQQDYISSIEKRKTKLVISNIPENLWGESSLSKYILDNYEISATIAGQMIWKRLSK